MPTAIPCPPGLLRALAHAAGLPTVGWVPLTGGATNAVWAHRAAALVLRVACPDTEPGESLRTVTLAGALAGAGVPVVAPATVDLVRAAGRHATVWRLVPTTGPVDYAAFGAATRTLHDRGADLSRTHPAGGSPVPAALDHQHLRATLRRLVDAAAVSAAEQSLLEPWVDRLAVDVDALGYGPLTDPTTAAGDPRARLVHDDLWVKNAIPTGTGRRPRVVLADCDNLAWGPADYDLAFLTRGVEAGVVTAAQAAAFAAGYGAPLPDLDTAWALARAHRLRWVLHLAGRRAWLPTARETLAAELPRWATPQGPRPS